MYNLSKDYEKLYQLVCDGNQIVCFVDYDLFKYSKYKSNDPLSRDICLLTRKSEFNIRAQVRGLAYFEIDDYLKKYGTEKELFCNLCNELNLEWIVSNCNSFNGSNIVEVNENILIGCITPEARELQENILNAWDEKIKNASEEYKKEPFSLYGFVYWLCRYSGLVKPAKENI